MVRTFGSKTSRVFDFDAKSLQLLVSRSGKAITDAEGILLQDLQALKISQLTNLLTYSGCVDLPPFRLPDVEDSSLTPNFLIIPEFRALINNEFVWVRGTQNPLSPLNYDNYVELKPAPNAYHGITIVYLEAWYQVLDEQASGLNHGFYPNNNTTTYNPSTDPRYYFPYGNTLAHINWVTQPQFRDDLLDPLVGLTSGRVQLQYALRATQIIPQTTVVQLTEHLKNFGMTHPSVYGRTFFTPVPSNFVFAGDRDPGLYACSNSSLRTVDGNTYAIPLAVIYQRNSGVWSPMANAHGTSLFGGNTGNIASQISGRPDGKFYDKPYPDDIIDTRSTFLGGSLEDYKSTIKQAASRLWEGSLRLKLAEPPSTDPNAHQLGQTLLSQEYIGVDSVSPAICSPLHNIASADSRMSWAADSTPDTMTFMVIPSMKDQLTASPVSNTTTWESGDKVTLTAGISSIIETATIYTLNQQAQVLRVPPAYISITGLGSNSITLSFLDIGADIRFNISKPLWVAVTNRRAKSFEHLRYVPQQMHTPLYFEAGTMLPCGRVSDYALEYEDSVALDVKYPLRSYKRNFDLNTFGTVRRVRVNLVNLTTPDNSGPIDTGTAPVIGFTSNAQSSTTPATVLSWSVGNATRVTLKNVTTNLPIGDVPVIGSIALQIIQTTEFLLTAYNGFFSSSQTLVISPATDASGHSVVTGTAIQKSYSAPGGALNPENIQAPYAIASLSLSPGFGAALKHVMVGCIKATLHQTTVQGGTETTDLQIRHQYFTDATTNQSLTNAEIGVFGHWEGDFNPSDYIEFEILVVGEKTFHYNSTVQGITAVTETVAPSQNAYLFFSAPTSSDFQNYSFQTYPEYAQSTLEVVASVPSLDWSETRGASFLNQRLGGVFEGVFGFGGQSYVFVKLTTETWYRAVPCSVQGFGSPLLKISIPQITLLQVEDVLVLAQATTLLRPASTTLISYNYIPYQGEGDPEDTYSLTYLDETALVTTFGTGSRSIPGLSSTSSVNSYLPIASSLPAGTGWRDADLTASSFSLSGAFSGTGNPVYGNTDFLKTTPLATISGHLQHLLNISADSTPALSPRSSCQRGFSKNTIAFSYVVETPQIISSGTTVGGVAAGTTYWVNVLTGNDSNSGLTRDTPRKSLQATLDALPSLILETITINVDGTTTLATDLTSQISLTGETPYGSPQISKIYSLINTSFNTQGEGVVIVQKDPTTSTFARMEIPTETPFTDYPVYGWLHTNGNLVIKDFSFVSGGSVILAAYPGTRMDISNCAFTGGAIQVLSYDSKVSITETSFSDPSEHCIVATSGGAVTLGDLMSFSKTQKVGYTFVVEKNSTLIITEKFNFMGYPLYNSAESNIEFLIKGYSTLDTSSAPGFLFTPYQNGSVKISSFSTLLWSNFNWFGQLIKDTNDTTTLTVPPVI